MRREWADGRGRSTMEEKVVRWKRYGMKSWTAHEQDASLHCCRTLHVKHAAYASALYTLVSTNFMYIDVVKMGKTIARHHMAHNTYAQLEALPSQNIDNHCRCSVERSAHRSTMRHKRICAPHRVLRVRLRRLRAARVRPHVDTCGFISCVVHFFGVATRRHDKRRHVNNPFYSAPIDVSHQRLSKDDIFATQFTELNQTSERQDELRGLDSPFYNIFSSSSFLRSPLLRLSAMKTSATDGLACSARHGASDLI
ncbi:hypothetical protein EVAR_2619_1 [Eumeta japonica]|uniref:Uncharacterized protein n=1 Tax=Eumeta variegata TaxID=151549 RepID=A0A4C1SPB6_EUMVA|nr:hypothetical protein EVAR_2619_1 [Eumeta japonica]